jgi:hypothetical protein
VEFFSSIGGGSEISGVPPSQVYLSGIGLNSYCQQLPIFTASCCLNYYQKFQISTDSIYQIVTDSNCQYLVPLIVIQLLPIMVK